MKTIYLFLLILLSLIKDLQAQPYYQCYPPALISPTGLYYNIDAPTIVWHPIPNPDSVCTGYVVRIGIHACFGISNWVYYSSSITDSCMTVSVWEWLYFFDPDPYYIPEPLGILTWNGAEYGCYGTIKRSPNVLMYSTLINPVNNTANVSLIPSISWSSVTNAVSYKVSIYKTPTFLYWHYDTTVSLTNLTLRPGVLSTAKNYWWKVKPYNSTGGEGPYSDPFKFQTTFTGIPAIPIQYSPPNGSAIYTLTPTLDWDSILNASTYTVQLASDSNFTTIIYSNSNVTNSFVTIISGLSYSTYYWRVKAVNSYGSSAWSYVSNFSIVDPLPPAPNLVSPPNGSTGQSVTPLLDWDSITIANSYQVQVSKHSNFSDLVLDSNSIVNSNVRIPSGKLLPDSLYYWKVRGINVMGQGSWSATWNFRVSPLPSAPSLLLPLNGAVGQSLTPKLDWEVIPTAANYRVQISLDSVLGTTLLDSITTIDSLTVPVNALINNTRYYWRVNASNVAGTGPWSSVWHFNTLIMGVGNNLDEIPTEFKLYINYPNPFNPSTIIKFDIPKETLIKIVIYDILGKVVQTLIEGNVKPGKHEVEFEGTNYPSGVYFYKLESETFTHTKKMVLIK